MTSNGSSNTTLGYAAAGGLILIWAMWLVVSRAGAVSSLTSYDLAAIRYGVSAVASIPFVLYFKPWKTMTYKRMFSLSFLLGPVYILSVYFAFDYAPAAHGGIYMNGTLPAVTLLLSWLVLKQKARAIQIAGVVLIFIGTVLTAMDVSGVAIPGAWRGDILFVIAAFFFAGYMVAARAWSVTPTQVMLCSSMINAVYVVPIWYFFLPSGLADVSTNQLLLQIFYQGLLPGLVGLMLVAYATQNIGSASTSACIAAVPALGALLAAVFLKEIPGVMGWLSIAVLTPGILMVTLGSKKT